MIDLNEIRKKQKNKKDEIITIPPNVIDPVLYAEIERDYAEFLRFIIEKTPQILFTQFCQVVGKSTTHGYEMIRRMKQLGLVGEKSFRGLKYMYPLTKAMSWYHQEKGRRGSRSDYSDPYLFEQFMKVEYYLYNSKNNGTTSIIDNLDKYLRTYKYPVESIFTLIIDGRLKLVRSEEMNPYFTEFRKIAISKIKKGLTLKSIKLEKNYIGIAAFVIHRENMNSAHYYDYLRSLYQFTLLFNKDIKRIIVAVLVEKELDSFTVEKYFESAKKSILFERHKQIAKGQITQELIEIHHFILNLNLFRYYQSEELGYDVLTDKDRNDVDQVKIPELDLF